MAKSYRGSGNYASPCRWGAHWRHLANTTEPSVCSSDVAVCQITLTTCSVTGRLHVVYHFPSTAVFVRCHRRLTSVCLIYWCPTASGELLTRLWLFWSTAIQKSVRNWEECVRRREKISTSHKGCRCAICWKQLEFACAYTSHTE